MRKKIKTLTALVSASLSSGLNANQGISAIDIMANMPDTDNVSNSALLNRTVSHRLASHRSHSSHRSHRSSSGGGGYSSPSYTAPAYTAPKPRPRPTPTPKSSSSSSPSSSYIKISDPLGQQPRPAKSYPSKSKKPKKTKADVKKIVEQVQLALLLEGLYEGPIDGVMGKATRKAILKFKKQNNITSKVILGAETLNALGVVGF